MVIDRHPFAALHESAYGTKRTSRQAQPMSAFGGKADIAATEWNFNLRLPQKLRQLGDAHRDPPRLMLCRRPQRWV
jgi:hypothetical protein